MVIQTRPKAAEAKAHHIELAMNTKTNRAGGHGRRGDRGLPPAVPHAHTRHTRAERSREFSPGRLPDGHERDGGAEGGIRRARLGRRASNSRRSRTRTHGSRSVPQPRERCRDRGRARFRRRERRALKRHGETSAAATLELVAAGHDRDQRRGRVPACGGRTASGNEGDHAAPAASSWASCCRCSKEAEAEKPWGTRCTTFCRTSSAA